MLLVIDIGNTNTVFGLYRGEQLVRTWRLRTDPTRTGDEWAVSLHGLFDLAGLRLADVDGVSVACVVPPVLSAIRGLCQSCFGCEPLVVDAGLDLGMPIRYDDPQAVGADRIVNAVAAYARKQCGLIVIDLGTATTFDVISARGEFLGGAIAPGLGIAAEALAQRASKLPRVEIACPPRAIAGNTVHSIQSGLFHGYVGLVDGIVARMQAELPEAPCVLATGGLAGVVAPHSRTIDAVDPDLTLDGLRIIFERNQQRRKE